MPLATINFSITIIRSHFVRNIKQTILLVIDTSSFFLRISTLNNQSEVHVWPRLFVVILMLLMYRWVLFIFWKDKM